MKKFFLTILTLFGLVTGYGNAKGVYQTSEDFLNDTFQKQVPTPKVIWITGKRKDTVSKILQHAPSALRIRYWQQDQRSAWILNEIGKEQPITVGVIINNQQIESLKVLTFRESRGWEVKHPFFTEQFNKSRLNPDLELNKQIDGISGATLSVRALHKLAKLALYLSSQIKE